MTDQQRPGGMYSRAFVRASAESDVADVPAPAPPPRRPTRYTRRALSRTTVVAIFLIVIAGGAVSLLRTRRASSNQARQPAPALVRITPADAAAAGVVAPSRTADKVVTTNNPPAETETRIPQRPATATEGQLVIESRPAGARVTVNGIGWGTTPVRIRYLPFGPKQIRVIKDGYISAERTVRLDPDTPNATVRVTLRER
jgi:hypothetical protein